MSRVGSSGAAVRVPSRILETMMLKRLSALLFACLVASPSYARCHGRPFFRHRVRVARVVAPKPAPQVMGAGLATPQATPQVVYESRTVAADPGDPSGFVAWLNATRASYGLPAIGYDANLAGWASMNNSHQASRGVGHYVMGPARRQNSAMGSYSTIGGMWMSSPGHRSALLDPTIRFVGIAGSGSYWTFNAY